MNDLMALMALRAAALTRLRVPEDLSIVGFDDIPAAGWSAYSLTTIRQPVNQMVAATLEVLTEQVQHPEAEPVTKLVSGPLIPRTSARLPDHVEVSNREAEQVTGTGDLDG